MTTYQIPINFQADESPVAQVSILRSGVVRWVQFGFALYGATGVDAILAGALSLNRVGVELLDVSGAITGQVAQSAVATQNSDHAGTGTTSSAPVSNLIPVAVRVNIGDLLYAFALQLDTGAAATAHFNGFIQFGVED